MGPNAKHNLQVGDSVVCWSPGSLATHVRADAHYCVKLPDNIPFSEAVTLPTVFISMFRGLKELCSLAHGETVLIHSAAGADGIAALQIARVIGAKVGCSISVSRPQILNDSCRFLPLPPRMSRKAFWKQNIAFHSLVYFPRKTSLSFQVSCRVRVLEA